MAHDNDEIGPQEFAGAEVHACECDVCMKMTACTNYSGAMECRNCLADNFLMGEARDSNEAARWAKWVFEGSIQ
jgi:ribosomal protein L40E